MILLIFLTLLCVSTSFVWYFNSSSTCLASTCSTAPWSYSDRNGTAKAYNALRSKIAKGTYVAKKLTKPAGKDLTFVSYDCSLESSAQSWANGCPSGHSGDKGKGENIYWSYSTAPINIPGQGAAASSSRENEFQQYGWKSNNLTIANFNTGIGHATQMAWWSLNKIGCGVKKCASNLSGYNYMIIIVCQYTPQGNIINTNIYNESKACSGCASGQTCDTSLGLCK